MAFFLPWRAAARGLAGCEPERTERAPLSRGRLALRAAVLVAGWLALMATTQIDIHLATEEVEGILRVRSGEGRATLVILLEGLFPEPRGEVTLGVSFRPPATSDDGGPPHATYRLTWPDDELTEHEGDLERLPYFREYRLRPASLCGGESPCELRVLLEVEADPAVDRDIPLAVTIRAWNHSVVVPGRMSAYFAEAP